MPELYFSQSYQKASDLLSPLGPEKAAALCHANSMPLSAWLEPAKVFSLSETLTGTTAACCLNRLNRNERQILCNVVGTCGSESLALAAFLDRYFSDHNIDKLNTSIGAATTAASARLDAFEVAMIDYQKALHNLWEISHKGGAYGRGAAHLKAAARAQVTEKFNILKTRYKTELSRYAPEAWRNKNRGDALSNATRGIELATRQPYSLKKDIRLNVADRVQASKLGHISKLINGIGQAAVALDASLRTIKVMGIHAEGGDWMRESVRQLTGFGLGGAAGITVGQITFSAGVWGASQAGLIVAGPLGWAVLGGIFAMSLSAGYVAGSKADNLGQRGSSFIMNLKS